MKAKNPNVVKHRTVIIGGGFGGLKAALELRCAPVNATLIDRRNFHLFQPLLYQVATGGLSPANVAAPLRSILKRQKNVRTLMADVTDIDVVSRQVIFRDGGHLDYDTAIIAAGAGHCYFGAPHWEKLAPGLKSIEDATEIRRRILSAFESAEMEPDPEKAKEWLTFVVIGAGPTGVELAGALAEISHFTLKNDFRAIDPTQARIVLLEGSDRVLPPYPKDLSASALRALQRLGVAVRTGAFVTDIQPDSVTININGIEERIAARTALWAAGVQASPLGRKLAAATGAQLDKMGRLIVEPDLSLPNHPEILIVGDLAHFDCEGKTLPAVAPVAMQQGRYAARVINKRLNGKNPPAPFRYKNYGAMATIGRAAAVADLGWIRFNGFSAWLAWLFIHLMYIVAFENRALVFIQWAWSYFTRNRSARLITGKGSPFQ